ncbi:GNAT family N-acetyltransferase [Rhodoferax sp.]|uniref:GNAT family N-acetyltransferase n=1 Tax=Rhodoferax sp. TaxID=50421 RepID=UPI0025D4D8B9|nr:GNAT family N-acetyltransferase [Rhodoferax sp.]
MQIRRLDPSDATTYRALRLRALREHADAFTSSFEEESARPLADTEKRLAGTDKLWGAFVNGTLAAMVGLSVETRTKNHHKATLVGMYVAPEYTRRGLAHALVETALHAARASGIARVVLTVTDNNPAALALYQKTGFTAFGTEPDAIRVDGISFGKTHMTQPINTLASNTP